MDPMQDLPRRLRLIYNLTAELAEAYAECRMLRTHICEIDKALGAKPGCGGSAIEDITRLTAENAALRELLYFVSKASCKPTEREFEKWYMIHDVYIEKIRAAIDAAKGE